ncbi:MAG: DUF350 domain-containing protein [Burkholderiales bacterium]|nr:DUF350 domain-containing protein [Burkholderiales bacterium]
MDQLLASLSGLDDYLAYLALALALLALFLAIYVRVTPYREFALIREGNLAASLSLSGALLGFVVPLASAIAHSVAWWDMLLWGAAALLVQLAAFGGARLLVPGLATDIPAGRTAQGLFLGAVSLAAGILNAAAMTY